MDKIKFQPKPIENKNFNSLIALPKFEDTWVHEPDMNYILFLYYYIKSNQYAIDGHYEFRVNDFLLQLYSKASISSHWKDYQIKLNNNLSKLKAYGLINADVVVSGKDQIILIPYENLTKDFKDGSYTLFDYGVFLKILDSKTIEKDLLFYCTLFLLNRARDNIGITSYEDITQVLGGKTTIIKYLKWFKDNEIMDYYSMSHKLDVNGVPKRGNTYVATWKNKHLIEDIRSNDVTTTSSKEYLNPFNERFDGDKFFDKSVKMIRKKYGLINSFLLYRLWNELPFEFTWECLYKYLNAGKNYNFFSLNDDGEQQINKKKLIDKIVNVAKTQENDILQYIEELNDHIFDDTLDELPFVGRVFEKDGYTLKPKKVKHVDKVKPVSSSTDEAPNTFKWDEAIDNFSNGLNNLTDKDLEAKYNEDNVNRDLIPEDVFRDCHEDKTVHVKATRVS